MTGIQFRLILAVYVPVVLLQVIYYDPKEKGA